MRQPYTRPESCLIGTILIVLFAGPVMSQQSSDLRETAVRLVEKIQRADYEADRARLQELSRSLTALPLPTDDHQLASRLLYWRGFALWRRAFNGFSGNADPGGARAGSAAGAPRVRRRRQPRPELRRCTGRRDLLPAESRPPEPSWGEPELLMNLALASMNQANPDLRAADEYASRALSLVPHWRFVRETLLPRIRRAGRQARSAEPAIRR